MPSRPDLPGLLGKDGGPPPPAAITGPWAPPTLSISPPVRVALGVRPERRPGLPQVPHSSPPALTPAPGRPPRDGALRPEVAGDACTQTTLPAAGPPHGSAHTPHTCAHPALSTRRRGAAETLRPTACICLVSPGAEAVFLAGPGGLAGGEVVCCPRPREEPGVQRNCQSTALGGESAPSEGLYPRSGHPRRLGARLPGTLTHPGPRPATCPCAGQGRCRHTLGRAAAPTDFQGTGSDGHAPRRQPQELVRDSCWHPSGHVCRWAGPGLAHLDSR